MSDLLKNIKNPQDLKKLDFDDLKYVAEDIRSLIIDTVSKSGGHLASNLGTVELTIALLYSLNLPYDKIVWDVGHQAYTHKILTGRYGNFSTLRQYEGVSGFPSIFESEYDSFGAGHSSTSISAALGLAKARDLSGDKYNVTAIIGDGALTGGMALEALNNAAHINADMMVVLNDNEMSISKNIGGIAQYLSKIRMQPHFQKVRTDLQHFVRKIPKLGDKLLATAKEIESHLTFMVVPGVFFESLGFMYFGPFDGHNIEEMVQVFNKIKDLKGPRLIHIVTQKGKGYSHAEVDSTKFHSSVPFDVDTGISDLKSNVQTYTKVFGDTVCELANRDKKIVAITAAMVDGTGLTEFSKKYPDRFFDVGIAEQHAVTFSAAMALQGYKPVVAVYSTFLQRALDQIIHDVCIQKVPVIFAIDRAGIVGEDGVTHQGNFDLSYLRFIPNMVIMAPKDENELKDMLYTAFKINKPCAIRFPRGIGIGVEIKNEFKLLECGKSEVLHEGDDVLMIAAGNMVYPSILASEMLKFAGFESTLINARFIKPIDSDEIIKRAKKIKKVVVLEENSVIGGFAGAVLELLADENIKDVVIKRIGLPDKFIEHGHPSILREKYMLTADGIAKEIKSMFQVSVAK